MIRRLISFVFLLVVGWLVYTQFYGTEKEQQIGQEVISNGKKTIQSVFSIFQHENDKFQAGAYDDSLEKVGSLLKDLGEKMENKNQKKELEELINEKERIEEADFLEFPLDNRSDPSKRYDVIVCSMVLNCVTTPIDRGKMLALLYHQLRPGGLCFFTIPKFCVTKSAFLTHGLFKKMLGQDGVGFTVKSSKESPRIAFFILERPMVDKERRLDPIFTKEKIRNKGKKFPNQFSVVLKEKHIFRT